MHEGGHGRTANELGKRRLVPDSKADHGVPRNSLNSRSTEFVWVCCLREPYVDLEFGAQGNFQSSHHGSRTGIAFVHRRGQIVHLLSVLQFLRDRPFIQRERTSIASNDTTALIDKRNGAPFLSPAGLRKIFALNSTNTDIDAGRLRA